LVNEEGDGSPKDRRVFFEKAEYRFFEDVPRSLKRSTRSAAGSTKSSSVANDPGAKRQHYQVCAARKAHPHQDQNSLQEKSKEAIAKG